MYTKFQKIFDDNLRIKIKLKDKLKNTIIGVILYFQEKLWKLNPFKYKIKLRYHDICIIEKSKITLFRFGTTDEIKSYKNNIVKLGYDKPIEIKKIKFIKKPLLF